MGHMLLADGICLDLTGITAEVKVRLKTGGPWVQARLIDGHLHWVAPRLTEAGLAAICAAYERANHEVPVAIAALREAAGAQVLDAEIRPACQGYCADVRNGDEAMPCCQPLQSAPKEGLQ